jgi:hypothetical protein
MTALARKLGLLQAVGLSVSIIAPTAAMALNVSLTAQAAGRAAPVAFALGRDRLAPRVGEVNFHPVLGRLRYDRPAQSRPRP